MDEKRLQEIEAELANDYEYCTILSGDVAELIAEVRRLQEELHDVSASAGAALCIARAEATLAKRRQ